MKKDPKGRNDGHSVDYSKITKHIYVGSNLCKGNICPVHGPEFARLGVCVEINLDNEKKEMPPDNLEGYVWLPVVDGYAPDPLQLDMGSAIINAAVMDGNIAYIHCRNGHGRGPTLVASYFVRFEGKTVEEAEVLIKEKRPEIHIEDRQKRALEEFRKKWGEEI